MVGLAEISRNVLPCTLSERATRGCIPPNPVNKTREQRSQDPGQSIMKRVVAISWLTSRQQLQEQPVHVGRCWYFCGAWGRGWIKRHFTELFSSRYEKICMSGDNSTNKELLSVGKTGSHIKELYSCFNTQY